MGKPLKTPPVYFTVAQVRFNPLLKLVDFLPAIQENLRQSGYPAFTPRSTTVLRISIGTEGQSVPQPTAHEQYLFTNVEQTHSFVLNTDSLTFQSTKYGTYEEFSAQFLKGLELIHEAVRLDFTERVGLRYLDHVMPKSGEDLMQYVPEVMELSSKLGGKTIHSYCESLRVVGNIGQRTRVLVQDGPLAFPPDLVPEGMVLDNRFVQSKGMHALIDTDGFQEGRQLFSLDTVQQQLDNIHVVISDAFKQTVTPYALQTWDE
jgi:uncharacterized protein (TIGR04255 family)